MKLATVEAQFLDIKGCPTISGKGRASAAPHAIQKAFKCIVKDKRLKRKHWTSLKATITVVTVKEEKDGTQDGTQNGEGT